MKCILSFVHIANKHLYRKSTTADDMPVIQQEQENRETLERFRSAHMDAEEREVKLQQAEGLNNSIKLELLSSDTERRHLREKVSLQDREIQEVE